MCTALLLHTVFALFCNSHAMDTIAMGINAMMWFLMVVEARREIARLTTTDPPNDRY
jgi:hypothetical protein